MVSATVHNTGGRALDMSGDVAAVGWSRRAQRRPVHRRREQDHRGRRHPIRVDQPRRATARRAVGGVAHDAERADQTHGRRQRSPSRKRDSPPRWPFRRTSPTASRCAPRWAAGVGVVVGVIVGLLMIAAAILLILLRHRRRRRRRRRILGSPGVARSTPPTCSDFVTDRRRSALEFRASAFDRLSACSDRPSAPPGVRGPGRRRFRSLERAGALPRSGRHDPFGQCGVPADVRCRTGGSRRTQQPRPRPPRRSGARPGRPRHRFRVSAIMSAPSFGSSMRQEGFCGST